MMQHGDREQRGTNQRERDRDTHTEREREKELKMKAKRETLRGRRDRPIAGDTAALCHEASRRPVAGWEDGSMAKRGGSAEKD